MITIIIPNYNGEKILFDCLNSVKNQTYTDTEIIVVDNNSEDRSSEVWCDFNVKAIINKVNYGFAKAVNQGIKAAKGDFVFLLNNDVVLKEDTLEILHGVITSNERIFSVQAKMLQYHNPDLIDDAGDIYTPFGWAFQRGHGLSKDLYNKSGNVFSACAGAALYRKTIFDKIGLFDEAFFAYMEDVDIGFRARRHGYLNLYEAKAIVWHYGSASFGKKMSPLRAELSGRNNYLTVRNNMPYIVLLLNSPYLIVGFALKYLKFILQGHGKSFRRGLREGFRMNLMNNKTPCFKKNDIWVFLLSYKNTVEFLNWKIRQIMKVG